MSFDAIFLFIFVLDTISDFRTDDLNYINTVANIRGLRKGTLKFFLVINLKSFRVTVRAELKWYY